LVALDAEVTVGGLDKGPLLPSLVVTDGVDLRGTHSQVLASGALEGEGTAALDVDGPNDGTVGSLDEAGAGVNKEFVPIGGSDVVLTGLE
jgi:hypothetical protein